PAAARRAWGASTRKACQALADGVLPMRSGRDAEPTSEPLSRGVALGLFDAARGSADLYYQARALTRLTHHDSRCVSGVFVVARAVSDLVAALLIDRDALIRMVVEAARFSEEKALPEDDPLSGRLAAVQPGASMLELVARHGNSDLVLEAIPFAVGVFLAHSESYEEAVVQAAKAGGGAAANTFLVGALSGALHGFRAIPTRLRMHVEDLDGLLTLADQLSGGD
ncbi:MAG: hypothetical protein FJX76_15190, partial [Armatimonadetes bacterium]|nr:hypothetical protein [Armatimonadota bacterium]